MVLKDCWEYEYKKLSSFGWRANEEAQKMGLSDILYMCNRPRPYVFFVILLHTTRGARVLYDLYLPRWVVERGIIVWERQHGLPAVLPLTARSPDWETLVLSSIKVRSMIFSFVYTMYLLVWTCFFCIVSDLLVNQIHC